MGRLSAGLKTLRWNTREFLWPRRCAGCGLRDTWLCEACGRDPEPWSPTWCGRCGVPALAGACRCDALPAAIDAARSAGWHDGWIRNSVHLLKYSDERARAVPLGEGMAKAIEDLPVHDLIVPVPLHRRRERDRGFNQSQELALSISFVTGVRVATGVIERIRETTPQIELARDQRLQNVLGAFAVREPGSVEGRSVLVVDDVLTTGATIGEVAQTLKAAGAVRTDVVTFARASERHAG